MSIDATASAGASGKPGDSGKQRIGKRTSLERLTFNMTPRARDALERVTDRTGDSRTDAINRALQIYDYLEEIWEQGGQVKVQRLPDAEPELLKVF